MPGGTYCKPAAVLAVIEGKVTVVVTGVFILESGEAVEVLGFRFKFRDCVLASRPGEVVWLGYSLCLRERIGSNRVVLEK